MDNQATEEMSALEKANASIALQAAEEGMVLLKNDGVLPLSKKKIALYGLGARFTIKGGTGSGEVNNRYNISVEQGLINSGFEITDEDYLNSLNKAYQEALYLKREKILALSKKYRFYDFQNVGLAVMSVPFILPFGRDVTMDDVLASSTDTALYVLSRQAGEGRDRKLEKGEYYLSDEEERNLHFLRKAYKKLVLIINTGSSIDLKIEDELKFNAIVFMGQAGQEGGNALGELLCGSQNFSGKLTASWAKDIKDLDITKDYSYLDGNVDKEIYRDGIYVGYRYYDAFAVKPRYPFGFGLTYSSFELQGGLNIIKDQASVAYSVINKGLKEGRQTVQVYFSAPNGKLKKEIKSLIGFKKTGSLKPGGKEEGTIAFKIEDMASFDSETSCYVLEKGSYYIYIGFSSAELTYLGKAVLNEDIVTLQCLNLFKPEEDFAELSPLTARKEEEGGKAFKVLKEDIQKAVASSDLHQPNEDYMRKAQALSRIELCTLLVGDPAQMQGRPFPVAGEVGQTSERLHRQLGLNRISMADGPAGLRLVKEYFIDKKGRPHYSVIDEDMMMANWVMRLVGKHYQRKQPGFVLKKTFETAFPVGIVQAQSFDTDLFVRIGQAVSSEMSLYGINCWLAPGMNIMRHPLCGRNFEYYSEDPFLTGTLAGHVAQGVSSITGHTVTFKHFCCNSQEENRYKTDSVIQSRALREIYLKGFKIALSYKANAAVMTSYNKLNGVYTNSCFDLCSLFLRGECGFDGFVMTDWGSVKKDLAQAKEVIKAGNDIIMPGQIGNTLSLLRALHSDKSLLPSYLTSAARLIKASEDLAKVS